MADYTIKIVVVGEDRASGPLGGVAGALGRIGEFAAGGVLANAVTGTMTAIGGGAKALVGGLVGATTASAELSSQIATIGAVSGLTQEELGQVTALIDELGINPNLKVSATEAANAVEMLSRNGMEMGDILAGGAEKTVLLANATGADFATAADIATDVMAVFNMEASDMGAAVDGIAGVVNRSKFSVEDYALALAQGGGVAAVAGVEFADFNTAIAGMSPLFASGSDAGTSFKTMLQRLQPQSKEARNLMGELGLLTEQGTSAFYDAAGGLKDMEEIVGLLNDSFGDLTEAQRTEALGTIFGTDAMRAAAALAGMTREEFSALQGQIGQVSSLEMASMRVNTLAGDMDILAGAVETAKIQVGRGLEPIGRAWAQALTPVVSDLAPQLAEISALVGEGIAALTPDIKAFSDAWVVPALDGFIDNLGEAKEAVAGLSEAGAGIGDKIGAALMVAFGGEYTVDADAEITKVEWGDWTYLYDATSVISSVNWGEGVGFVYDAAAQVISVDYTSSVDGGGVGFVYDAEAGITEVNWNGGDGGLTYTYSAAAQVWSVAFGDLTYTYNAKAAISAVEWGDWRWVYNAESDITIVNWGDYVHVYDGQAAIGDVAWGVFEHTYPVAAEVLSVVWTPISDWGAYVRRVLESDPVEVPVAPVVEGVEAVEVPARLVINGEPEVAFLDGRSGFGLKPVEVPVTPVFSATPTAGWGVAPIETTAKVSAVEWGEFTNMYLAGATVASDPEWGGYSTTYDVQAAVTSDPEWGSYSTVYDAGAAITSEPEWGNWTHEYSANQPST